MTDEGMEPEPVALNKRQLASAMRVNVNTIGRWLDEGLPYVSGGSQGSPYAFDVDACRAWRERQLEAKAAEQERADALVRQMRLELDPVAARVPEMLDPDQQRQSYEAAARYMAVARQRRELVEARAMVDALESAFAAIRDAMDALPDMWARELGLSGAQVEKLVAQTDTVLDRARRGVLAAIQGDEGA